jgi:flagellum-specific peptidoglycan hydrolase FlgJ
MLRLILILLIPAILPAKTYDRYIQEHLKTATLNQSECGIPVSIQFAVAILESGGGRSELAKNTNNQFGIMAFADWGGDRAGKWRCYSDSHESFRDYAVFMHNNYINAVGKDWQHWAKHCTGYGGTSDYWIRVKNIVEFYNLEKYDEIKQCGFRRCAFTVAASFVKIVQWFY